jgi:hypothetical protein
MTSQHYGVDTLSDNVIAFPGAHRGERMRAAVITRSSSARDRRAVALSGAELNGRLLLLLGICMSSAAILLSAVHILQRHSAF